MEQQPAHHQHAVDASCAPSSNEPTSPSRSLPTQPGGGDLHTGSRELATASTARLTGKVGDYPQPTWTFVEAPRPVAPIPPVNSPAQDWVFVDSSQMTNTESSRVNPGPLPHQAREPVSLQEISFDQATHQRLVGGVEGPCASAVRSESHAAAASANLRPAASLWGPCRRQELHGALSRPIPRGYQDSRPH